MSNRKNSTQRNSEGYVLIGIVSSVSFVMLLIVVSIGQQSIISGENVDKYQDWRIAQTSIFSCISIFRMEVIGTSLLDFNDQSNFIWRLRDGVCDVTILNETPDFYEADVQLFLKNTSLAKTRIKIEKITGTVLSIE